MAFALGGRHGDIFYDFVEIIFLLLVFSTTTREKAAYLGKRLCFEVLPRGIVSWEHSSQFRLSKHHSTRITTGAKKGMRTRR
jgi:hypothetical protein